MREKELLEDVYFADEVNKKIQKLLDRIEWEVIEINGRDIMEGFDKELHQKQLEALEKIRGEMFTKLGIKDEK